MDIELVGCYEACVITGISRQRFSLMNKNGRVPKPVAELKCGPIWLKSDIEEWAAFRNRKPGKPRP